MNIDMTVSIDVETEIALTELVMNCPELGELEALLSRFNIFHVLKAARHEIRHSNMLAWLMDPEESHGLSDRFIRRWLMNIVHSAGIDTATVLDLPSPIEIDALEIDLIEVARESSNIDLLVIIQSKDGDRWVVCVENKVHSAQHSNQLRRYRGTVERRYSEAKHRLFLLLSKHDEEPEDPRYISSSYALVEQVLRSCFNERADVIGPEPKLLIQQYIELLSEEFVGDNRAAQLARQIYRSHKKAIDFILQNIDDPIAEASRLLEEVITANAAELKIIPDRQHKGLIRFLPEEWNISQNSGGTAWGTNSRYVLCEITFWTKRAVLSICVGKAPDLWADKVWTRAESPPFKQEWKKRPRQFIKPYKSRSDFVVEDILDVDAEDLKASFLDWLRTELGKDKFREAVEEIRLLLLQLEEN